MTACRAEWHNSVTLDRVPTISRLFLFCFKCLWPLPQQRVTKRSFSNLLWFHLQTGGSAQDRPRKGCHTDVPDDRVFSLVCTTKENMSCLSGSQLHYRELIAIISSYCSRKEDKLEVQPGETAWLLHSVVFGLVTCTLSANSSSELLFLLPHISLRKSI